MKQLACDKAIRARLTQAPAKLASIIILLTQEVTAMRVLSLLNQKDIRSRWLNVKTVR